MPQYQFEIRPRNGLPAGQLQNLRARRIGIPLNRPPECSATLSASDNTVASSLLKAGESEIVIYRNGDALETVFQLASVGFSGDPDGVQIDLNWLGILSYLQHGLVYAGTRSSAIAQSRIVWGWINTFQSRTGASVYAITDHGAPATDPSKSVTIEEDTDLLDAIIAQSERDNGYDFAVDAGRRFRCYYPQRGSDKSDRVVFEYGTNVTHFSGEWNTSPGELVTDARVYGGPGSAIATATDSAAQALYGRREASVQYSDVITQTGPLQDHATRIVEDHARPQSIPQLVLRRNHPSIPWGAYEVGDTVGVRINELDINDIYRIVNLDIDIDENDNETITASFNEAA